MHNTYKIESSEQSPQWFRQQSPQQNTSGSQKSKPQRPKAPDIQFTRTYKRRADYKD